MISRSAADPFTIQGCRPNRLWWVLAGFLFLVGFAIRLYDLPDPPLDFHPNRQMHSALIARGMYYQNNESVPQWQRDMAAAQQQMEGHIEPQIFERTAALAYRLTGGEDLRIPRVIAITAWMVGSLFLVWLALDIAGPAGALVAGWFLFTWPYGVISSRAFMPEPIAMLFIGSGLWAAVRWTERGGYGWAVLAGILAGLAIYIKSVSVFVMGPALIALVLFSGGLRKLRSRRSIEVWLTAALAILPYAIYHINGVYIQGYLADQFSGRFFPEMWSDPAFYLRWLSNLGRVMAFEFILASAVGLFLIKGKTHRAMLIALWIGYAAYGMVFAHHISTHDYYHLLLFPAIALGLAGAGEGVYSQMVVSPRLARIVASAALIAAVAVSIYAARTTIKRFNAQAQAETWQEIGEQLGESASVAALVEDYGVGLKYWGWINPVIWPTSDDMRYRQSIGQLVDFPGLFAELAAQRQFFVIEDLADLELQPELKAYLLAHYPVFRETPEYLIFDLRSSQP